MLPSSATTTATNSGTATPTHQPKQHPPPPHNVNPPPSQGLLGHLRQEIDTRHADIPLIICCAISGICDSVAFNATGAFTSMQTGNTIILSLGAASLPPNQPLLWLRALISLASFWLGCFLFARFVRLFSNPRARLTLFSCFAIQTLFLLVATILAQTNVVPAFGVTGAKSVLDGVETEEREHLENNIRVVAPLALLAFQFGGQIVASRVLGLSEVPTNVLTSLYCDLLSDSKLFATPKDEKRNRRFWAVVMSFVGGIVGGWMQRSKGGMAGALWIAVGLKVAITGGWLVWTEKEEGRKEEKSKV